jgi:hypothetical protein
VNALNRRPWLFFGPAALAAGGIAATLTLASRHEQQRGVAVALLLFVGWSFAGAGLIGWTRRPHNRTGMLMVAVGFGVFLAASASRTTRSRTRSGRSSAASSSPSSSTCCSRIPPGGC